MKKDRFVVVEHEGEAVLCRVDSESSDGIDATVEMEWDDLRQHVIDLYNRYAETHPGTNPDFFVERFSEFNYSDPIPAWIGSKSPLVYHVLGRPGMVTIGCAALAFGRALNHGWAILATPEIGDDKPGWWPDGWSADDSTRAEERILSLETAGAALDEIMSIDQLWTDLFGSETVARYNWSATQAGLVYESRSRYTFYANGSGRCLGRLIVRTSQFGPIYIDLDDGKVSVEMDAGYQEFHEAYRESCVPDQVCRYIQELGRMGAWILPSAGMFVEAKTFIEEHL